MAADTLRARGARRVLAAATLYLVALVALPLGALVATSAALPRERWIATLGTPRVLAALQLSLATAAAGAALSAAIGLLLAWVLVRHRFPGRRVADALIDLPFALPTAVAGISLTALYAPQGWLGAPLARFGISVAFSRAGIVLALVFLGVPFVVRTLQPVLADLQGDVEEAARTLGASPWQTFRRVILPALRPAWITGALLAFARALGEYGSIVFISGNMPMRTELTPLLIMTKLEQYDIPAAAAIAVALLAMSLALFAAIHARQAHPEDA